MKRIFYIIMVSGLMCFAASSCRQGETSVSAESLSKPGSDAMGAYLTEDNEGNPVLCWTEKRDSDSLYVLKYAVFNPEKKAFGAPVLIPVSAGMSATPESMGKIAFKSDNTVIAVFARSFRSEQNPFAGGIYYTLSADGGKSWADPEFLHSDTSRTFGRSFFDLTRLDDGEVAASWLDGRFGTSIKGLGLFFAKTGTGTGFGQDTCLYKGTCECCRTDILQDGNGTIHIAYRSILFPPSQLGRQVRDMVHCYSKDGGATFSEPQVISNDNWAIEGCPHTGPSLAITDQVISAAWFTAGGNPGIYYASAASPGAAFQHRQLITVSGRHPQLIALDNGELAMVCEEVVETEHAHEQGDHDMGGMLMDHGSAGSAAIVLRILDQDGKVKKTIPVTDGSMPDHHAVIYKAGDQLLISWTRDLDGYSSVYYSSLSY